MTASTTPAPRTRGLLGHPKGLYYLAFTEAWERFSYYGMTDDMRKIGMGAWLVASANLILVGAILVFGNDGLSPIWPFLYFAMMGFAFLFYWPVTLALVSRAAPAPVNSTMMGVAFLTLFAASNIMGWLGGFYQKMPPIAFWSLHAAIAAAGGVAVLLVGGAVTRALQAPQMGDGQPQAPIEYSRTA